MKKKIVLILAMLLCAAMLLSSCGLFGKDKEPATFNSIINKDWVSPDEVQKVLAAGDRLSFGSGEVQDINSRYAVIEEDAASNPTVGSTVTRLISVYDYTKSTTMPILTLQNKTEPVAVDSAAAYTQDKRTSNYVDLINGDYFAVLTVTYDHISSAYNAYNYTFSAYAFGAYGIPVAYYVEQEFVNTTMTVAVDYEINIYEKANTSPVYTVDSETVAEWAKYSYDYNTNGIYSYENTFNGEYETLIEDYNAEGTYDSDLGCDLYVRDNVVYKVDEDGEETLVKDFGISKIPSNIAYETDKYYIAATNYYNGGSYKYSYAFYNKSLELVYIYTAPEYISSSYSSATVGILNNNNLIVQYAKQLHTDAKKYDYRTSNDSLNKYSLTTLIVDPEAGTTEEIDVDYVLVSVTSANALGEEDNYFVEGVENFTRVRYIDDDKQVDISDAAIDWVSMDNEGKILGSVKFDADLVSIPYPIDGGYYVARNLLGDYVIFNSDGSVVNTVSATTLSNMIGGKYIETDDAIYNIEGDKICDLKAKKATNVEWLAGGSFIVEYYAHGAKNYDLYVDGALKQTYTESDPTLTVNRFDRLVIENENMYYTVTFRGEINGNDTYEYSYYNANGDMIGTFSNRMNVLTMDEDYIIGAVVVTNTSTYETTTEYYRFNFVETK